MACPGRPGARIQAWEACAVEDDDLDLELESELSQTKPKPKPAPAPAVTPPKPSAAPAAPTPAAGAAPLDEAAAAKALRARKAGLGGKLVGAVSARFAGINSSAINAKTAGWALLVLLILWFLGANWSPVRVSAFGFWYIDLPGAVAMLIGLALGAVLLLLWQRITSKRTALMVENVAPVSVAKATAAKATAPTARANDKSSAPAGK